MPFILGLTGSIGMGKSTTSSMFLKEGIPVWDADAFVHELYSENGRLVSEIADVFPACIKDNAVDRQALKKILADTPEALPKLEAIIHPLAAADRQTFIERHAGCDLVVLDIPLLFETGADRVCDAVLVVSVPEDVQRERVMSRGTMSAQTFDMILGRQMPDAQKRGRADYVITTLSLEQTLSDVRELISHLTGSD
ncbi:dephospho-CoA kinase [Rhodobacteraceae bacterium]|nr:dephospho-CoA kinase [Paracoccaceae bacterium]